MVCPKKEPKGMMFGVQAVHSMRESIEVVGPSLHLLSNVVQNVQPRAAIGPLHPTDIDQLIAPKG